MSAPRPAVATVPTDTVYELGEIWGAAVTKVEARQQAESNVVIAPVTAEKIGRLTGILQYLHPDDDGEHLRHELRRQVIAATRLELGYETALASASIAIEPVEAGTQQLAAAELHRGTQKYPMLSWLPPGDKLGRVNGRGYLSLHGSRAMHATRTLARN